MFRSKLPGRTSSLGHPCEHGSLVQQPTNLETEHEYPEDVELEVSFVTET
jgi:hypothetical protein